MNADWEECSCGRGGYDPDYYNSCYDCFLERRSSYARCIFCGAWHSPAFETCYDCRTAGRDEAAHDLRLVILGRDAFRCQYCGITEGELQEDPRLIRPACPAGCNTEHNHRWPCQPGCKKKHQCLRLGDKRCCQPGCHVPHQHLAKDDDGIRVATLHVDHIMPCAAGGTADPWNLQILCGVCNISKGAEWLAGSRHHKARRLMMAAYLTYLNEWLDDDERDCLLADAEADQLTTEEARVMVAADYVRRVKAGRN